MRTAWDSKHEGMTSSSEVLPSKLILAQLLGAAKGSPSCIPSAPSLVSFTCTDIGWISQLQGPTTLIPHVHWDQPPARGHCLALQYIAISNCWGHGLRNKWPYKTNYLRKKEWRDAEGFCEQPCASQPCDPSLCWCLGLFLPRGRRWHHLCPGRLQPAYLTWIWRTEKFMWSLQWEPKKLYWAWGNESGALVQGAAWHRLGCPEHAGSQLCWKHAERVNFSFCWAATNPVLSLAAIAACIPHSAGLVGGLSPPLTPARFASLAEPFWGLAGISVTEEISNWFM